MAIGKTELVALVAERCGDIKKRDVEAAVNATLDAIVEKVASGDEVNIPGFGKFDAIDRAAREGTNPATGKKIKIPAKRAPRFKAGKAFKDAVEAGSRV